MTKKNGPGQQQKGPFMQWGESYLVPSELPPVQEQPMKGEGRDTGDNSGPNGPVSIFISQLRVECSHFTVTYPFQL